MTLQGWEGEGMGLLGLPATLGHVCVGLPQDLMDAADTAALAPLTEVYQLPIFLNNWIWGVFSFIINQFFT